MKMPLTVIIEIVTVSIALAVTRMACAADKPQALTTLANPTIRFTVPENHHVTLRRGPIEAVIVDNHAVDDAVLPGHRTGYHGIGSLKHAKQSRNIFVPTYSGLNFEFIHDGTVQFNDVLDEPRHATMELRIIDERTAELYQAPTPHWGLESCARYHLLDDDVIELTFECIPRRATYRNGYIGLFWASYIHQPESLDIHFLGSTNNSKKTQWIRGVTPRHGIEATHRAANDDRRFAHDEKFPVTLAFNFSPHRVRVFCSRCLSRSHLHRWLRRKRSVRYSCFCALRVRAAPPRLIAP